MYFYITLISNFISQSWLHFHHEIPGFLFFHHFHCASSVYISYHVIVAIFLWDAYHFFLEAADEILWACLNTLLVDNLCELTHKSGIQGSVNFIKNIEWSRLTFLEGHKNTNSHNCFLTTWKVFPIHETVLCFIIEIQFDCQASFDFPFVAIRIIRKIFKSHFTISIRTETLKYACKCLNEFTFQIFHHISWIFFDSFKVGVNSFWNLCAYFCLFFQFFILFDEGAKLRKINFFFDGKYVFGFCFAHWHA